MIIQVAFEEKNPGSFMQVGKRLLVELKVGHSWGVKGEERGLFGWRATPGTLIDHLTVLILPPKDVLQILLCLSSKEKTH